MRVLLFAHGPTLAPFREANGLPALPPGVKPVAWLGFTDELRPNVDKALNGFRDAGITLKVISGDNPETVAALARQAGSPAMPGSSPDSISTVWTNRSSRKRRSARPSSAA